MVDIEDFIGVLVVDSILRSGLATQSIGCCIVDGPVDSFDSVVDSGRADYFDLDRMDEKAGLDNMFEVAEK